MFCSVFVCFDLCFGWCLGWIFAFRCIHVFIVGVFCALRVNELLGVWSYMGGCVFWVKVGFGV